MKIADTKIKKTILIVISSIIVAVALIIIFISPIAKYLIEKYDEKYTGRQIKTGWVYVNPFTGYIHISNLKIYESRGTDFARDDSVFFSAKGLSADFALYKLFSKTIEISDITLDQPKGIVIQKDTNLNFNDLIKKFTPEKPSTTPSKIHFNILDITIKGGEFHYQENRIPINYFIKTVNIESTGKRWNSDTIAVKFSFISGIGTGDMKGNFMMNFKTNGYRLDVVAHHFDLSIIEQYLKDLTNNGSFSANLDAAVKASGNFSDQENLTASGMVAINDFHFGKSPKEDYVSFDKLVLAITEISPKKPVYLFDSISLTHPFLKYERYDDFDNIQTMFGKDGAKITAANSNPEKFNLVLEIARYVKVLAKNFFHSSYQINRLAIYRGDLKFNDYAISEKFSAELNPLYFIADSIDKNRERVYASLKTGIRPYGNISVTLSINPNDSMDFDIQYHLRKLPAAMFNPYLITYTSFPLDRGTIEANGTWKVRNGVIHSNNQLLVIDPGRTKRVRNKDKNWLPLPMIMALVRERGNVIDYEIPITGNLKDPKFHLKDVIVDLIENIFVKPATTSYRMKVKYAEKEIEKSLTLKWEMRKSSLKSNQEKFVNKMADYLETHKEATIDVYPMQYGEKEKEYILFFEAKKKYFLLTNHKNARSFSESDSEKVDKSSVKDPSFVHYLNKLTNDSGLFTIQDKCAQLIGPALIDAKFNRLNKDRVDTFLGQFKEKSVRDRVKIHPGQSHIPYNGFSFFKITYAGELPEELVEGYEKMNDFNNKKPREKFKNKRRKNSSPL